MTHIKSHHQLSDEEFIVAFESCQLAPALFSHEAHLRLAWLYLQQAQDLQEASHRLTGAIRAYVAHLGAEDKYHETLTVAALQVMRHFMQKTAPGSFIHLIRQYPRLLTHFKDLLAQHYSAMQLHSAQARVSYQQPDLLPFT